MRPYLFVVLLVLTIGIVVGCTGGKKTKIGPEIGGVEAEFIKGKPPLDGIYEERPFGVEVKVKNFLEKDISGEVCAYDSPGDEFGGIRGRDCKPFDLSGAVFLDGEFIDVVDKRYSFGPYTYSDLPLGLDDTNVKVEVTYNTNNKVSASFCLKKDPGFETDFPCEDVTTIPVDEITQDFSPVTVNQVDVKTLAEVNGKNTIILDIVLKKASKGKVVRNSENEEPLIGVSLKLAGTSGEFSCAGVRDGFIKMEGNEKKIRCTGDVTLTDVAYDDSVEIVLDFGYKLSIPDPPKAIRIYRLKEIEGG